MSETKNLLGQRRPMDSANRSRKQNLRSSSQQGNLVFKTLVDSGFISAQLYGANHCFSVSHMDDSEYQDLMKICNKGEEGSSKPKSWKSIQTMSNSGEDLIDNDIKSAIDVYKNSREQSDEVRLRVNIYGCCEFHFDFNNVNLYRDEAGYVAFPHGVLFFSDDKNSPLIANVNVLPDAGKVFTNEKNKCIYSVTDHVIKSYNSFRTTGKVVAFYASRVTSEGLPVYTIVEFETVVSRDANCNGMIKRCYITNCNNYDITSESSDEVECLLTHVFAKNMLTEFEDYIIPQIEDYIWGLGKSYQDYDLTKEAFVARRVKLGLEENLTSFSVRNRKPMSKSSKPFTNKTKRQLVEKKTSPLDNVAEDMVDYIGYVEDNKIDDSKKEDVIVDSVDETNE